MHDDKELEHSIKEVLTFGPRRPGWIGWAIWIVLAIRALLVLPILLTFYGLFKLAQTVFVIGGGLLAVAVVLGFGLIILMALFKFAGWALS